MKSILRYFSFIFLLLLSKESFTQIKTVKFATITGTNGISLGKINAIIRDKYGYLWFSDQSNRCIIRFDGSHMTRYQNDPQNPNSLGGYYPECLFADSNGNIWIGFYGMGLDKFDPVNNKFTHYHHSDKDIGSLSNDYVAAVLVDHVGNIWVGDYGGVDLLNEKTGKFTHYHYKSNDATSLSCDTVRALYEDKAGELWVGTGFAFDPQNNNGGLNLFNRNTKTFTRYMHDPKNPHSLVSNKVRAIYEDSYGNFWIGTDGDGLHTMDRKTGLFTRYTYNLSKPNQLSRTQLQDAYDHLTFITEDADKKIWIGTLENGITRYDPLTKQIFHYGNKGNKENVLKDSTSWCATATPDGFVWMSTQNANLFKIDIYGTTIPFFGTPGIDKTFSNGALFNAGIYNFCEVDSLLWFCTDSGLIRKNLKTGSIYRFLNEAGNSNSLSSELVFTILKDKEDNLWIGTASGLNYYSGKTQKFTRYYPGSRNKDSSSNIIMALSKDKNSNIWIGTYGGGLYMLNPVSGKFINYKSNPADVNTLTNNFISVIMQDVNDLWIGTYANAGLNKMNVQTKKVTRYLPGLSISCFYKDKDDVIWIGTQIGLFRYDKKSDNINSFGENNPGNNIVQIDAITADNEDNLWISTESGLYMLNRKRDHVSHYGKEYGLPEANNVFYFNSSFTGQDGELYFGNSRGYYAFFPEKLRISTAQTPLYFKGLWLGNKEILPGNDILKQPLYQTKEITLNYNQNVFSFSATFIDFRDAAEKKIFYKLENYDADWRTAESEDRIPYFKVPPGKYIFHIKTTNSNNDDWTEKSIGITILPPWWTTWWAYCIYGLLFIIAAYRIHRYQKERIVRAERERSRVKELAQAKEIEKAYHELKTTQLQLIQSEKMASLGELTAGIAHEIQNPLNFVNNFSEVNKEMLQELKAERLKPKKERDEQTEDEIISDVIDNEEKINHHGKRADAIVKNMLQHSRTSSGKKEPTDINALCDEYLKLSYHGMRAKDKSFNADLETDFNGSIGKINIIPQDIGRVLLNLFNNAFYAVNARLNESFGQEQKNRNLVSYTPKVSVSTKKNDNHVVIKVKDNGNGIPKDLVDKIFQPFFTTKPTGEGTGLGLSLSYDIIKAHGGEIKVETKDGEGSEFIIYLPG
jgi:ligand-binding sensor domain-containing protein/signal transduction histidine kinase